MTLPRFDTEALRAQADLVEIVRRYVKLKRAGKEFTGLCPFHDETSPSFTVHPVKGFVHCFGCGAHHDVFGFLQRMTRSSFVEVCKMLEGQTFAASSPEIRRAPDPLPEGQWVPLLPVPDDTPELLADHGWTIPIWNPKRPIEDAASAVIGYGGHSRYKPASVFPYRNAHGALLGYVLRIELPAETKRGKPRKWTPQVTWCIGPDGMRQWCLQAFPEPRPLLGLDDLFARRSAPVLLVEGEPCRDAAAALLPQYVAMTWPGGSSGIGKVDWSPLEGRDVVLWPDADDAGRRAMLGYEDIAGRFHPGIAQALHRIRVRSLRYVDPEGQPKGWDIADAAAGGWTAAQVATWAAHRVAELEVVRG